MNVYTAHMPKLCFYFEESLVNMWSSYKYISILQTRNYVCSNGINFQTYCEEGGTQKKSSSLAENINVSTALCCSHPVYASRGISHFQVDGFSKYGNINKLYYKQIHGA